MSQSGQQRQSGGPRGPRPVVYGRGVPGTNDKPRRPRRELSTDRPPWRKPYHRATTLSSGLKIQHFSPDLKASEDLVT